MKLDRSELCRQSTPLEKQDKEIKTFIAKTFENMIHRGFATQIPLTLGSKRPDAKEDEVFFTAEGLLVGKVIAELEKKGPRLSYFLWSILWGHVGGALILLFIIYTFLST